MRTTLPFNPGGLQSPTFAEAVAKQRLLNDEVWMRRLIREELRAVLIEAHIIPADETPQHLS